MYSLLFRNRWFAVGWVVLTLASVWAFAGKDGGADQIGRSVGQVQAQRETVQRPLVSPPVIVRASAAPKPALAPTLQALPGSDADPADPKVGDVFVNPVTGERFRAVRRGDPEAAPAEDQSSSAALPKISSSSSSFRSPR